MKLFSALLVCAAILTAAELPRKAPSLAATLPDGTSLTLAPCKDKVCIIVFLFTTCADCGDETLRLSNLFDELEPRGLHILGVAVNENAAERLPAFLENYPAKFRIGAAPFKVAQDLLSLDPNGTTDYPQMILIDRTGNIRFQTTPRTRPGTIGKGFFRYVDEFQLRTFLDELLDEDPPTTGTKK